MLSSCRKLIFYTIYLAPVPPGALSGFRFSFFRGIQWESLSRDWCLVKTSIVRDLRIGRHSGARHPGNQPFLFIDQLADVMILDVNMLCFVLGLRTLVNQRLGSLSPLTVNSVMSSFPKAISLRKEATDPQSSLEGPKAMYSALVVDVDTVRCFLQDKSVPSMKQQYPMTNFRSSGSLAKLLSAYSIGLKGGGNSNPL